MRTNRIFRIIACVAMSAACLAGSAQTTVTETATVTITDDQKMPGERTYRYASEMVPGDWSLGLDFGVAAHLYAGDITDYLKGCAAFNLNLYGGYQNFRLYLGAMVSQPGFKSMNFFPSDAKDRPLHGNNRSNATSPSLSLMLGYKLIDTGTIAITPRVGVAWNSASWNINNYSYQPDPDNAEKEIQVIESVDKLKLSSASWKAAVDFDFRFNRSVSKSRLVFRSEYEQLSVGLRVSPFITHCNFSKDNIYNSSIGAKGLMFGVSVSLLLEAQSMRF